MKITKYDPFVMTIDNALDDSICDAIIQRFEKDISHFTPRHLDGVRDFTEINVSATEGWEDVHALLAHKVTEMCTIFHQQFHLPEYAWQQPYALEQIRMKRYMNNGADQFGPHVDVGSVQSSSRFLVCFWYLNDVAEGGETAFLWQNEVAVKPKRGRAILFPPMWTHPHEGRTPISNPKYIIGSYARYV